MKKITLLIVLLLTLSIHAQQDQSEFKKETITFLKLTGAGAAFEDAITQLGTMVSDANKAAYTKEARGTLDGLYSKMADFYMEDFTQGEIKKLIAFYKTDLGKKLAKKQLSLVQKAMSIGQEWGIEVQGIARKYN